MTWNQVSEGLPRAGLGDLMLYGDTLGETYDMGIGYFDHEDGLWRDIDGERIDWIVTHWMPLPDPPGGE